MSDQLPAKIIDWEAAKVLFCRGVRRAQICKEVGCSVASLDKRVTRERWIELRDRLDPVSGVSNESRARVIKDGLVQDLEASVRALPGIPQAKNSKQALTRAQALGQLTSVADMIFGGMAPAKKIDIGELAQAVKTAVVGGEGSVSVTHLPNGFAQLSQGGKVWIEDQRHVMPNAHLYANCKPPQIIDVPGRDENSAPDAIAGKSE